MPVKASEAIFIAMQKAGIDSSEAAKKIVAIPALSEIELADDEAVNLTGLLNQKEARNNKELKDHYFAQALNAADKNLDSFGEALELSDEEKADYTKLKTYDRINYLRDLLAKKIDAKTSAAGADKKVIKEQMEIQINALKAEIEKERNSVKQIKAEYEGKMGDFHYNQLLQSIPLDTRGLPEVVIRNSAKQLVEDYLKTKNAVRVWDGEKFVLKNGASTDLDYMENGSAVSFEDVLKKVAADNKLLKVNPNPNPNPNPTPNPTPQPFKPDNYNNDVIKQIMKDSGLKGLQPQS